MRGGVEPLAVAAACADGDAVAHVERDCDLASFGCVNGSLSQHGHIVCDRDIVVGGEDRFCTSRLAYLFQNSKDAVTDNLMVV